MTFQSVPNKWSLCLAGLAAAALLSGCSQTRCETANASIAATPSACPAKPSLPLRFVVEPVGQATTAAASYDVRVVSDYFDAKVDVEIVPAEGVRVDSGPKSWTGTMRGPQRFAYTFSVPDEERHSVVLIGHLHHPDGSVESVAGEIVIDLGKPSPAPIGGRVVQDGRGNTIRVFNED